MVSEPAANTSAPVPATQHTRLPRLLIAASASGSGKTMITTGLLAALTRRGMRVSPHKVGPDYIDPGYHEAACGRPGRNLDAHLVGEHLLVPLLLHGALEPEAADIAVIEGVMGLFDGSLGTGGFASSAHVAQVTGSPVVLVVNCASSSRSVGAVVKGFATFDPALHVAGVILNNTASPRHEAEARAAVETTGVPVVGSVPRLPEVVVPSRHLGLIPAAERRPEATNAVAALADMAENYLDLDSIVRLAQSSPELEGLPWDPVKSLVEAGLVGAEPHDSHPVIAVAGGAAFTFGYTENVELLTAAGASVVTVDPLRERRLPPGASALVLPGGFPQMYATSLAANAELLTEVRRFVAGGGPVVAECAGMLYLARTLEGEQMAGVLPIDTAMSPRLTLGYRTATAATASFLAAEGEVVTGHVFHRTRVTDADPALARQPAWCLDDHRGGVEPDGFVSGSVHASYLHTHWAGRPQLAAALVAAARAHASGCA